MQRRTLLLILIPLLITFIAACQDKVATEIPDSPELTVAPQPDFMEELEKETGLTDFERVYYESYDRLTYELQDELPGERYIGLFDFYDVVRIDNNLYLYYDCGWEIFLKLTDDQAKQITEYYKGSTEGFYASFTVEKILIATPCFYPGFEIGDYYIEPEQIDKDQVVKQGITVSGSDLYDLVNVYIDNSKTNIITGRLDEILKFAN